MAVYTPVNHEILASWITQYDVGTLQSVSDIPSGIENSNFYVTTSRGQYVLTLFERLTFEELPFYLKFMQHLATQGIPCPNPVLDRTGNCLKELAKRPAALVPKLPGISITDSSPEHCAQLGTIIARMHIASKSFPETQENPRGFSWCALTAKTLAPFLDTQQKFLVQEQLEEQAHFSEILENLPLIAVHADLFRDNILFIQNSQNSAESISGVIDFYFSGCSHPLLDLAIAANDWCINNQTTQLDPKKLKSLINAYHAIQPLTHLDEQLWQFALRAGAFRFWLSRLDDWIRPRAAALLQPKDPNHFERMLIMRRKEKLLLVDLIK